MDILVIIPIYNPDNKFKKSIEQLMKQKNVIFSVMIIDSGTKKDYKNYVNASTNMVIKNILERDFNHGKTRQLGIDMFPNKDIYVFLTQDAILYDEYSLERLLRVFSDLQIGCAYGRQLPHESASFFSRIARLVNYPKMSFVKGLSDRKIYGMKTPFISNSFAAYRGEAIKDVVGFPSHTILGEDMCVAAKMLMKKWKVAYVSDACVYHSHNYTIWQEFQRYFDTGVFHAREKWIREEFGQAEGAGIEFLKIELKAILKTNIFLIINMVLRDGMKFIGYRLGLKEKYISKKMKRKLSMNKRYWDE